ncbi:MAG: SDR family oxidoreductase [Ilumatobacteraceae bacterium]|nr:SDR family oxidoreductase [Actinomycetota bacterium]NDD96836.1 SDR family oxidoreductase [Actinomycetota bacterium]NDE81602.1 SDR family oxidoreductase [Actinomycetota bacterium]NDF32206.1 SDR family oxidoreductase [Acidimicrobiia bacterium]
MALTIDFSGRVALITGGTKGVGRGIAQRFADAGATVVVCARNIPDDLPSSWTAFSVDLREPDEASAMIDGIVERFGRLDMLVNNAGGSPPSDTATASANFAQKIVAVNLFSAMWCSQAANRHMQNQPDGGSIVNIGSVSAERPAPTVAAYGAAKAGLANYTRTTGQEWLPKVRVNLVTVGMVRTELAHLHYGDEEGVQRTGAQIPIGRLARPEEIGDACVYLSSPLASYVSGATIEVHGGGDWPPFLDTPFRDTGR